MTNQRVHTGFTEGKILDAVCETTDAVCSDIAMAMITIERCHNELRRQLSVFSDIFECTLLGCDSTNLPMQIMLNKELKVVMETTEKLKEIYKEIPRGSEGQGLANEH